MSQLAERLLDSTNLPIMGVMNENYKLMNQVPMPSLLQNQSNMPKNNQKIISKKITQSKPQNGKPKESK